MLRKIVFLILSINFCFTYSQIKFSKVFEKSYDELPIKFRIDNSGVYGISSFDISDDKISLTSFDNPYSYIYHNNRTEKVVQSENQLKDFVIDFRIESERLVKNKFQSPVNNKLIFKKSYLENNQSLFLDADGRLSNSVGDEINVSVINRNQLKIDFDLSNTKLLPLDFKEHIALDFPGNLGCADLIGLDKAGNIFIFIETYNSEIPLKVQRYVYTLSSNGNILSVLNIPSIKFLYTLRDFQIDAEGNLYHLLCEKERILIFKLSGLTGRVEGIINYPEEYNYSLHFNDFVGTHEFQPEIHMIGEVLSSRVEALRIGESYVLHKYSCNVSNLAPGGLIAPDGDTVKTPGWLITGSNARVPYKWGGFNSISGFTSGLNNGKFAGDIDTDGSSSYAVGVDCSGFVSRCWQLSYHASTSYMPTITSQYSSWDSLKPADAIHKVGHVRLFIERTPNGAFRVIESAGRDWDVSYWTFALSDLVNYTPRYYNSMVNDFSKQQPALLSTFVEETGKTRLNWDCDTTNVKGYRLYTSTDGGNWTLFLNENTLTTTSASVNRAQSAVYYRVSSVLNNSSLSESPWSNVLGVGEFFSRKKILIVDGFERKTGSWRGNQHTFILRYGKALQPYSLDFESVKCDLVKDNFINLRNYEMVVWMSGDESTENETFSTSEQNQVKLFLENGGKLFVTGSELGWDLYEKGNSADKAFYNQYLKASYISDNSASNSALGIANSCFDGLNFYFGQTYYEDYPDEISTYDGSTLSMKYSNNKGAGISYAGNFGSSNKAGKTIYLAFPLETTANDSAFNAVIFNAMKYFYGGKVTVIIEGLYNAASNKLNRRDTITAYLRNLFAPYSVIDSTSCIIDSITFSGQFNFSIAQTGDYFLILKHKNSIETWSKASGVQLISGISLNYDFSAADSQSYGNNLINVDGKWCIFSGDINQDGIVDLSDVGLIDLENLNFICGYTITDLNGDYIVDISDLSIADSNNLQFISKITP